METQPQIATVPAGGKTRRVGFRKRRELPLHVMVLPGLLFLLVFAYTPMAGMTIAFQHFIPIKGLFGDQKWVGLDNFDYIFDTPNIWRVVWNTLSIALMKIVAGLIVPLTFALLLNEVRNAAFKRTAQTIIYFPYFLSWVILGGIMVDVLSPSSGIVNAFPRHLRRRADLFPRR